MSSPAKLSPIAVPVRIGVRKSRHGRCYELAMRGVLRSGGSAHLVHGYVTGPGGNPMDHAWVEIGGIVYDPVLDRVYHPDEYRDAHHARVTVRYSRLEMCQRMNEQGHCGPWHDVTVAFDCATGAQVTSQRCAA